MEKIITGDGTQTLFNPIFNEAYHSIKAGAFSESLHKFIYPCKIHELAKNHRYIKVLDVGFGLGYNVASAIYVALNTEKKSKLDIVSIEIDQDILDKVSSIDPPQELKHIYRDILNGEFSQENIGDKEFKIYRVHEDYFSLKIIFGDGRVILQKLQQASYKFDAVFYDAFSPKVNAEMWTLDIFKIVYNLMTDKAILATYSAALSVRKALIEAGFNIGLIEPIGRKSYSTVATKGGNIPPLPEKEKERIENSPYSCVMRDKNLNTPRDLIYKNWENEVEKRKLLLSKGF